MDHSSHSDTELIHSAWDGKWEEKWAREGDKRAIYVGAG